jgi:hypothetical protein
MRTGKKNKNAGKPRFGKAVGDPRDVRVAVLRHAAVY